MSLLDNNILENTNAKNLGFPIYNDFMPGIGNSKRYIWETQYYGDTIIKDGISVNIYEHSQYVQTKDYLPNIGYYYERSYHIMVRIGPYDKDSWINFVKIRNAFASWEEARQAGYDLLCFFKEHRDFFEVLCRRYKYNNSRYRIPRPFYIKEIYNYNKYEHIR